MNNNELLEKVIVSDVPESYYPVVSLIGLDAFIKLCGYCSGSELYFPMLDTLCRNARNRNILKEYDGYNHRKLAQKYQITLKQVNNIIKGAKRPKQPLGRES